MGCTGINTNILSFDNNLGVSRYYSVDKFIEMQQKVVKPNYCQKALVNTCL